MEGEFGGVGEAAFEVAEVGGAVVLPALSVGVVVYAAAVNGVGALQLFDVVGGGVGDTEY